MWSIPHNLLIFSFAGLILPHAFRVLSLEAANAFNADITILTSFKDNFKKLIRRTLSHLVLPIICLMVAYLVNNDPETRIFKCSTFGILLGISIAYKDILPKPRVIPLSWGIIYGGIFAIMAYLDGFSSIELTPIIGIEFFKLSVEVVVVIGTILGACMTILWTMEPVNLQDINITSTSNLKYSEINIFRGLNALYMLALFSFILIGVAIWLSIPIINELGY